MAGGDEALGAAAVGGGKVACVAWIWRREEMATRVLAAYGPAGAVASPSAVEVLSIDPKDCSLSSDPLARAVVGEGVGDALCGIAVHPNSDELIYTTAECYRCLDLLL